MSDNKSPGENTGRPPGRGFGGSSRDFGKMVGRFGGAPRPDEQGKKSSDKNTSKGNNNSPRGKAQQKVSSAKENAKKKAVQTAAKSVGLPISDKVAGKIVEGASKYGKVILAMSFIMPIMLISVFVTIFGGDGNQTDTSGIPAESEIFEAVPSEVIAAYRSSAASFEDPAGNPLPWTLAFSIGAIASDHGRFSPFDNCDRHPERGQSAMFPSGVPDSYDTEDCGRIVDVDSEGNRVLTSPVGPFLFAPSFAGTNVEFQDFDVSLRFLNELIEEEAAALAESEGYEFTSSFPEEEEEIAARDAFWAKVISRLPIIPPLNIEPCDTPQPGFDSASVAGAVRDTWACELIRGGRMVHVVDFQDGEYIFEDGSDALNRIISEALHVASTWSNFGVVNSTQQMCGRTPILGAEIGKPVVVVGDSLTVGARDLGDLERSLQAAGATEVSITAISGASANHASFSGISIQNGAVVVVALGTNDTVGSTSEEFEVNLTALRDLYLDQGASQVYLLNVGKVGEADTSGHNAVIEAVASGSRTSHLNWSTWSQVNAVPYAGDGIHLTREGYQMRTNYITERLLGNLSTADDASEDLLVPELVNGEEADGLEKATYAGVFPMDEATFEEHNQVLGASRCDFGPNIHAAVKAFIAGESQLLEDRSTERGPYQPLLGGWSDFYSVSDYNFPVSGPISSNNRTSSAACRAAIESWVDGEIANSNRVASTGGLEVALAAVEVADASETALVTPDSWILSNMNNPLTLEVLPTLGINDVPGRNCGEGAPGEVSTDIVSYAASYSSSLYLDKLQEIQEKNLSGEFVDDLDADADSGIDGSSLDDVDIAITFYAPAEGVFASDEFQAAKLYTASQVLSHRVESSLYGEVDLVAAERTTALLPKFSSNGRSVQPSDDVVPMTAAASTSFGTSVVNLAVKVAGIGVLGSDTRSSAAPFADVPRLSGKAIVSTTFLAIGGVPYSLLDAVNETIADKESIAPGCTIDAAFLLATAKHESGPWWNRIQADGSMVPALVNDSGARGPFQFLQLTFDSFSSVSDADGNGQSDVQNAYDAARASLKYQCDILSDRYGSEANALDPLMAWNAAVDYHDGPNGGETREECRELGEHLKTLSTARTDCKGEVYAQMRVDTAEGYRDAMRSMYFALQSDPAYDPSTPEGQIISRAVTYAIDQVGKPYCRPMNEWDDNPDNDCVVPISDLEVDFEGSNSGGEFNLLSSPVFGQGPFNLGPDAFDCSGLTFASYYRAGMDLGIAYSNHQFTQFERVEGNLQPGDLLFYNWDSDIATEHVTMYIGSGMVVHAAGSKVGVVVNPVTSKGYVGATRPILSYSEENATVPVSPGFDLPEPLPGPTEEELFHLETDPTLAIYYRRDVDYNCDAPVIPDLYAGRVAGNIELLVVPDSWFEDYMEVFDRPALAAAIHTEGRVRIREEQCELFQDDPNKDRKTYVYWDLLAHEAAHALDYSLGWFSETLDFPTEDLGHAGTFKSPNRELFAFCMQQIAMGEDVHGTGRCPEENFNIVAPAIEAELGVTREELALNLDDYAPVQQEDPTQALLDEAMSQIGGAL